jgi:transposase
MQRVSTSRPYKLFAGIDVSAATFTVSCMAAGGRPSRPITIEQTAQGYAFLQQQLCASGISPQAILVVLEATGSYWITLATTLAEAGFAVSVINPAGYPLGATRFCQGVAQARQNRRPGCANAD